MSLARCAINSHTIDNKRKLSVPDFDEPYTPLFTAETMLTDFRTTRDMHYHAHNAAIAAQKQHLETKDRFNRRLRDTRAQPIILDSLAGDSVQAYKDLADADYFKEEAKQANSNLNALYIGQLVVVRRLIKKPQPLRSVIPSSSQGQIEGMHSPKKITGHVKELHPLKNSMHVTPTKNRLLRWRHGYYQVHLFEIGSDNAMVDIEFVDED
jgi:hypothetical protein